MAELTDADLDRIERKLDRAETRPALAYWRLRIPALVAEVRRLRDRVATLEGAMHDHHDCRICRALLDRHPRRPPCTCNSRSIDSHTGDIEHYTHCATQEDLQEPAR